MSCFLYKVLQGAPCNENNSPARSKQEKCHPNRITPFPFFRWRSKSSKLRNSVIFLKNSVSFQYAQPVSIRPIPLFSKTSITRCCCSAGDSSGKQRLIFISVICLRLRITLCKSLPSCFPIDKPQLYGREEQALKRPMLNHISQFLGCKKHFNVSF